MRARPRATDTTSHGQWSAGLMPEFCPNEPLRHEQQSTKDRLQFRLFSLPFPEPQSGGYEGRFASFAQGSRSSLTAPVIYPTHPFREATVFLWTMVDNQQGRPARSGQFAGFDFNLQPNMRGRYLSIARSLSMSPVFNSMKLLTENLNFMAW